jgi:hypothetical protein
MERSAMAQKSSRAEKILPIQAYAMPIGVTERVLHG